MPLAIPRGIVINNNLIKLLNLSVIIITIIHEGIGNYLKRYYSKFDVCDVYDSFENNTYVDQREHLRKNYLDINQTKDYKSLLHFIY